MSTKITIEQLTKNESVSIDVPGVGIVCVRDLTVGDRISAKVEASKMEGYKDLTESEKLDEITSRLVMRTITEPKFDDLKDLKYNDWVAIIEIVSAYHSKKATDLAKKRESIIRDFLGLKTENLQ